MGVGGAGGVRFLEGVRDLVARSLAAFGVEGWLSGDPVPGNRKSGPGAEASFCPKNRTTI